MENLEILECLLKARADINTVKRRKISPLIRAIYKKDINMINLLLDYGADINLKIDSKNHANNAFRKYYYYFEFDTPLSVALETHNLDIIKLLVCRGADYESLLRNIRMYHYVGITNKVINVRKYIFDKKQLTRDRTSYINQKNTEMRHWVLKILRRFLIHDAVSVIIIKYLEIKLID